GRTDGIEDGTADALGGEALDRHAAGLVETLGRLDQAEGTGTSELLAIHVTGEVHRHLEDDVTDEREVLLDGGSLVDHFTDGIWSATDGR
ncbi:MAG: hypothetical protein V7636_2149, partial [Actinomycetota bacterium]